MITNIYNNEEIEKLIFVIATGRSGSNMLVELINSIDDTFMRMEPTTPTQDKVSTDEGIINISKFLMSPKYIPQDKQNYKTTGCKLLDTHVWMCAASEEGFGCLPYDVKVVHLYRKNILEQFLSLKLARKNQKWISTNTEDGSYNAYDIEVDVKEFKQYEKYTKRTFDEYFNLFPNAYIVGYEDLAANPQEAFDDGLIQHLGFDPQPITFKTNKQSKKDKSEVITNFDSIKNDIKEYL